VKPLPAKVFDWEQEGVSELAEETTDVETPTAHQEGLAPVIGTIGLAGFERDGKIDPTVVNYLQELPARQSDNQ